MGVATLVGRILLACAILSAADNVWADDAQDAARRHFKSGVALFQSGDFTGALAEFEASHRDRPGASSLQNIALCLTRLHRYLPALETLDKLKGEYGATLAPEDRKAVEDSIRELLQLVGTVTLRVSPSGAIVSVNGKPLTAEATHKPIRLSSGEYTFRLTFRRFTLLNSRALPWPFPLALPLPIRTLPLP